MKRFIFILTALISGCATMPQMGAKSPTNRTNQSPDVGLVLYPSPQASISQCIRGSIDEVITGSDATIIWYQSVNGNGLTNVRLPMNYPLRIKVTNGAFCYDYFSVNSQ